MTHILVIEYEPRYIQRIEEAAAGGGLSTTIARTGDEAIQALPRGSYDLIVLSTIIPRYSTAQLIRSIRNDATNSSVPVLLTTSGYSGTDPRSDAMKIGATDMLIKPYAPPDFIQKVRSVLNLPAGASAGEDESTEETVRLSSKQIFGDLLDESHPSPKTVEQPVSEGPEETVKVQKVTPPAASSSEPGSETADEKRKRTASDDVDRMLADTLAGVRLPSPKKKKKDTAAEDLDKLLENTLSGLEPGRTRESKTPAPRPEISDEPAPAPIDEPATAPAEIEEEPFPDLEEQKVEPAAEAPEEPPFEGVGERSDEDGSGTTLIRDEDPVGEAQVETEPSTPDDSGHFGQYVLLEKIATGGMAEVWKARMRGLEGFEKIVAIKKILPHLSDNSEFIDMFVDEAKLAAQLSHNNIIHIYDLGKIDGSWFIAMEYNDGYDLKSLLSKGKSAERPLPVPLSLFVASKIASALDYAHRKRGFDDQELGVVHRDVSPQNVLISREGDIKICDFGIAKAASKASHTQAGALKGKLQYMSPEQAWGRHVDHRSDIFATAAVLFEMITGRKLFSGDSELSILDQVREARVPLPSTYNSEVSPEIDEIVAKGLEKDPSGRFATAGEMAQAIDGILSNYKPAPSSSDLARYITAIERPESVPMPAMPVSQRSEKRERVETPEESDQTPSAEVIPPTVVPVPAPVPEPAPASDLGDETIAVGEQPPATGDETVAVKGGMPEEEPLPAAEEDSPQAGVPFAAALDAEENPGRSRAVPIAIVLIILVAVVAGGAVLMMRGGSGGGGPRTDATAALGANTVAPLPEATTETAIPDDVITQEALDEEQLSAAPATLGDDDMALIEQAVRDRIEAERLRLEAQNRQETPARAQTERRDPPAETPPAATPPPKPATTPAAAAPAAEEEPASTSPPAATPDEAATPPAPQQSEPAAQQPPAAPAKPAVQRGQMVEPGTPGLVDPQMVSLKRVAYPPLARRNKVEGLVIVRALISEDGKVLETELLRGVSQNVGLNEAAMEMVRGGTFKAGTMESVPVRAWKTIPIPFKME